MGENSIFNIGSPDIDIILKKKLPNIVYVKKRYSINFSNYAILLWHPVTSKTDTLKKDTVKLLNFLEKLNRNKIIIYPNNDPGSNYISTFIVKLKIKNLRF